MKKPIKFYETTIGHFYHFIATDKICLRYCFKKPYHMSITAFPVALSYGDAYMPLCNFASQEIKVQNNQDPRKIVIDLLVQAHIESYRTHRVYPNTFNDVCNLMIKDNVMSFDVNRNGNKYSVSMPIDGPRNADFVSEHKVTATMTYERIDKNENKELKQEEKTCYVYRIDSCWDWFTYDPDDEERDELNEDHPAI